MTSSRSLKVVFLVSSMSRLGGGVSEVVRLSNEAVRNYPDLKTEIWAFEDSESANDIGLYAPTPVRLLKAWRPTRFSFSPDLLVSLFRENPDVVHVHGLWQFHCAATYLWSVLTGHPYVVTIHGMLEPWILKRSPRLKAIVSTCYQRAFLRRAFRLQALTEKEVADIRDSEPKGRITIIPNYAICHEAPTLRPKWWTSQLAGRQIFLYFGRIHEKKGLLQLLQAWEQLCSREKYFCDNASLVFCGWIDAFPEFLPRISELSEKHNNVIFAGSQYGSDKYTTLSTATFVVLPSLSEGLPMVVLEAWAISKPVLMTGACNLNLGFEHNAAIQIETDPTILANSLYEAFARCQKTSGN